MSLLLKSQSHSMRTRLKNCERFCFAFFGDVAKLADNDAAHCTFGSSECAPADLPEHIRAGLVTKILAK
jgi:hypothetical protein